MHIEVERNKLYHKNCDTSKINANPFESSVFLTSIRNFNSESGIINIYKSMNWAKQPRWSKPCFISSEAHKPEET